MEWTVVLYEVEDHVATITLNRPDRLNAMTFESAEQLMAAFAAAEADPEVRTIVLTGNGRAFCSGDDVEDAWGNQERMADILRQLADVRPGLTPEAQLMFNFSKPMVAAVNGPAIGIGMDFAINCDIVLASEEASFSQRFVKLGLMCDVTGLWRLPQLVGIAKAAELLLTGDKVGAREAERIGLVSRVVPADELLPAARALAARIAANPPLAVRHVKEGLRRATNRSPGELDDIGNFVGNGLARLFATADHKEAAMAFMEKRPAVFTGR